jgi:NADH:ubiquinone oxidoreductase subunit 5 (subunit L)/multisubunit Na+/H+ antiporter MnhA subunit
MKLGTDGIFFVTLIYLILSLLTTIILSYISFYIKLKFEYTAILFDIFNLPNSGNNSATTYYDFISINFIILILSIGTCVFLYSYSYFKKNSKLIVLLNLLLSFILGMIILVSAGDLITLLFGWEAIGISSFLLINF